MAKINLYSTTAKQTDFIGMKFLNSSSPYSKKPYLYTWDRSFSVRVRQEFSKDVKLTGGKFTVRLEELVIMIYPGVKK